MFFGWRIPGFMVYAAIVYSIVMSASMVLFGRALINRIEQRNQGEARLRYEMGRVRENAERIAMVGGADDEVKGMRATMQLVTAAWTQGRFQPGLADMADGGQRRDGAGVCRYCWRRRTT